MINDFLNLDNSDYSRVMVYLLDTNGIPHGISDITNFTGVPYPKVKVLVKRMFKFNIVKRTLKSGHPTFSINLNNNITKKFRSYYKVVVSTEF
jgi:DNA-binding transcriptional regulator GbsR (MarR family)